MTVPVRSFSFRAKHVTLRMLIGDCGETNASLTRYSCDFPESSRHIQRTVPMPDVLWTLPPIVATPWFVHFLISPTNMFCLLQMWTLALLSNTIVVESGSYGSKSLVRTRLSTFRTVVNADENDFTNGDIVALFFLIRSFFLCLFFLYLIPVRKDLPEPRRCGRYLRYVGICTKPSLYLTILDKKYITENPNSENEYAPKIARKKWG